jgi:KaiC/GvpD/RAD55 family RecA-like ATPase
VANELVIDGCERIRAAGNASLIVAHEGVLEGNLVQALTRSVDGIIRLKMKWTSRGPTRELFVEKMPFAPTGSLSMEYEITGKGIETKPGILRERSKTTHSLDQSSEVATRTRLALPKTERTPTGVSGLDFILEGGFPKGTFICLKGDVGTGTSTFCTQFTWSNLLAGEKVAYYCADQTPDMVIRRFKSFGWNVEPYLDKELVLIDVFHFLTRDLRSSEKGSKGISARRRILDSFMKTESERIGSLLGEAKVLPVIIDSFTALAPYLDLKSSYVLARMVADSARENNETFLAVVRSSVVEANLLHACLGTTDAVIELENVWVRRKLMRRIRIDKMAFTSIPSRQIEYEITTQGIRLVPQNR